MTDSEKLAIMKDRAARLSQSNKNIKCPGTLKKINRQIRNMEK